MLAKQFFMLAQHKKSKFYKVQNKSLEVLLTLGATSVFDVVC